MTPLLLLLAVSCGSSNDDTSPIDDGKTRLTILHTNDWQSHMMGWGPNAEYTPESIDDDTTVGGIARMKTLIDEIRGSSTNPVALYDAGDWMAGALFQLLATSDAAELQMMGALGYDAITLGNHEFDWGPQVLGEMISRANDLGVDVPIVAANTHPNPDDSGDDTLEAHFDSGRITATNIHEIDGITIGVFGLLGDDAQAITPAVVPASFSEAQVAAEAAVAELEAAGVDIVVAITHAGTGPDAELAEAVDGIDVIVGGHSHTALFEEIHSDGVVIVQAGAYTRYLGQLDLVQADNGDWEIEQYQLHELNDSTVGDSEINSVVEGFVASLEAGPLADLGYEFDTPIASIESDVAMSACSESGLGDFVSDAFRQQLTAVDPENPIDVAIESQGVIRDNFVAGVTGMESFSDFFRVMPLGFGTDDVPGYSLVHFYMNGSEVADACEVTVSISPDYGCDYYIQISGMRCTVDMSKSQFNRVVGVELQTDTGWEEIDITRHNPELYHIGVDSYVASLMYILEGLTFGGIIVEAKDENGDPLPNQADWIFDRDPDTDGVQEIKLWEALVGYAETFSDTTGDGVPDIEGYTEGETRIFGFE